MCALSTLAASSTAMASRLKNSWPYSFSSSGAVGRRIAARAPGDAAPAAPEMAHLVVPAAVVAAELVDEQDGRAAAGLLVVDARAVRLGMGHEASSGGCAGIMPPAQRQGQRRPRMATLVCCQSRRSPARPADLLDVAMISAAAAAQHVDVRMAARRSRYCLPSSTGSPASRSGASFSSWWLRREALARMPRCARPCAARPRRVEMRRVRAVDHEVGRHSSPSRRRPRRSLPRAPGRSAADRPSPA